ncbi:MAG: squalene/phytoene synthase family protein, partial [Pseudomonadota bacterium]|nr:squalene/phytoene synthase family protein [Pseudomonadota bacterium]
MTKKTKLVDAYKFCQNMAQSHYENFPVASVLLPQKLRLPISVIYAFSRTADDFADEGELTQETRLE